MRVSNLLIHVRLENVETRPFSPAPKLCPTKDKHKLGQIPRDFLPESGETWSKAIQSNVPLQKAGVEVLDLFQKLDTGMGYLRR